VKLAPKRSWIAAVEAKGHCLSGVPSVASEVEAFRVCLSRGQGRPVGPPRGAGGP
jgi:hypothetical protein